MVDVVAMSVTGNMFFGLSFTPDNTLKIIQSELELFVVVEVYSVSIFPIC